MITFLLLSQLRRNYLTWMQLGGLAKGAGWAWRNAKHLKAIPRVGKHVYNKPIVKNGLKAAGTAFGAAWAMDELNETGETVRTHNENLEIENENLEIEEKLVDRKLELAKLTGNTPAEDGLSVGSDNDELSLEKLDAIRAGVPGEQVRQRGNTPDAELNPFSDRVNQAGLVPPPLNNGNGRAFEQPPNPLFEGAESF